MAILVRESKIASVVVRFMMAGDPYWLLRWHEKWNDWSLLGGHVEQHEINDWRATSQREVEEEMPPLRAGIDFEAVSLDVAPTKFTASSRSHGGTETNYEVRWYSVGFLTKPANCLLRVDSRMFALCSEEGLRNGGQGIAQIVAIASSVLSGSRRLWALTSELQSDCGLSILG